jgi:hypothetical protein
MEALELVSLLALERPSLVFVFSQLLEKVDVDLAEKTRCLYCLGSNTNPGI